MPIYHNSGVRAFVAKHFAFEDFEDERTAKNGTSFENDHIKLRESVSAIFHNKEVTDTMEELFRCVENLNEEDKITNMYETLESLFRVFVNELLPSFISYTETMDLKSASNIWDSYVKKMLLVRSVFLHMDERLSSINSRFLPLWDLARNLFRKTILMHGSVQTRLLEKILDSIRDERSGVSVEKTPLRLAINMFIELDLYEASFANTFIRRTEEFYNQEAEKLVNQMEISDYLKYVHRRIAEEEARVTAYLSIMTRPALIDAVNNELIVKRKAFLLSSLSKLVPERKLVDLRSLYSLFIRIEGGISSLRSEFRSLITRVGREIVDNPTDSEEKDRQMIPRLMEWRETLVECISGAFSNDPVFTRTLQEAFEDFLNRRANKPAEFLAKYLDGVLRPGKKSSYDADFDQLLGKFMVIFRSINGKDAFQAFYASHLCKRLLLGRSASIDAEKAVLSRLKQECGFHYTRKLELMFQDIQLSQELSKNFRSHHEEFAIEFTVNVLAPSAWPEMPETTANYPEDMLAIRTDFNDFYVARHQGRKLTYVPSYGSCIVKAQFPAMSKELQVSEFQALILLQFNGNEDDPVAYTAIQEATGIEKTHLDRALLSLFASKNQRVLISSPMSTELTSEHKFVFNKKFTHNLTRIRFNQLQLKETKKELQQTEANIYNDRAAHVDCIIVRIMKARKTIEHNKLVSEILQQLKFPFKQSDVKKRIEAMITRDFVKRDEADSALYHYVA